MPNGQIELTWADGTHIFNIAKIKSVLELEEKCGVGVAEIFDRIRQGKWRMNDIRETLRLGLIGGGMLPDKALTLVQRYVDDRPWVESVLPAQAILMAAMVGVQGDEIGKKPTTDRAKESRSSAQTGDLSDPLSTDLERLSGSIPDPRTN